MGRQPWVIYGLMKTATAPSFVGVGYVTTTLVGFTALYGALAVVDFWLMARFAKAGPASSEDGGVGHEEAGASPAMVY